jgi:hypothetical protein
MEIGGLLNARAAADAQMRQHFQHPMQLDHRSYNMSQPQASVIHHPQQQQQQQQHQQMANSNGMAYPSMHPAQSHTQMYTSSYDSREGSQEQMVEDDFGTVRPKGDNANKQFNCSTCPKAFARRSDLARHGKSCDLASPDYFADSLQNAYTLAFDLTHVITQVVASVSSSVLP